MKFTVLTLFPEIFELYLAQTIMQRASELGIVEYKIVNIRDYSGWKKSVERSKNWIEEKD